jgi:hypothetical protein
MPKVTIELTRAEVEEAVRDFAAEAARIEGEAEGKVKLTFNAKKEVTGAVVTIAEKAEG